MRLRYYRKSISRKYRHNLIDFSCTKWKSGSLRPLSQKGNSDIQIIFYFISCIPSFLVFLFSMTSYFSLPVLSIPIHSSHPMSFSLDVLCPCAHPPFNVDIWCTDHQMTWRIQSHESNDRTRWCNSKKDDRFNNKISITKSRAEGVRNGPSGRCSFPQSQT